MTFEDGPTNVEYVRPRFKHCAGHVQHLGQALLVFGPPHETGKAQRKQALSMACESDRPDSTWRAIIWHEASMSNPEPLHP